MTYQEVMDDLIREEISKIEHTGEKVILKTLLKKRMLRILLAAMYFAFFAWVKLWLFALGIPAICLVGLFRMNNEKVVTALAQKSPDKPVSEIIAEDMTSEKWEGTVKKSAIVCLVLLIVCFVPKCVALKTEWVYEEYDNGYIIREYKQAFNDNTTEITIPDKYNGKDVVAIDDKAFYKNKKIEKVIIPDTVTEMGSAVFKGCKNLKTVQFGENIKIMGGECFKDCKSLKEAILPRGLTELRGETFMGCTSLKTVILPPNITQIKGNTFKNCLSLESILIPDGVTRIAAHAFYGCSSLSYVSVPDSVNEIGSSAFRRCDSLLYIEVPYSASINERAFKESPTRISYK